MFEKAKEKLKVSLRELLYSEKFGKWISGGESITGAQVDEETVFNLSVVWACVNAVSQTVGSLPIHVYRRVDEGKKRAPEHYLYDLLKNNPNPNVLPSTFKEFMVVNALTWGDGFAEIEFDVMGRPLALWPIASKRVNPIMVGREMFYDITIDKVYRLPAEKILHLPGLSFDGIRGTTPIAKCREAFGIALATQEFGGRYFSGNANPGGVLTSPEALSDKAYDRFTKMIERRHQGLEKAHRFMLLEEGTKWEQIGLSPADSQFLEGRKFSVDDIARMFRVPPHIIGNLDRATFSNVEQMSVEFLTHCIMPWLVKFEEAIYKRLIPANDKQNFFAEFLIDRMLRGDIKTRYEAYGVGLDRGFLSINDVRRMENMNEVKFGDKYYKAVNLAPIDQPAPQTLPAPAPAPQPEPQEEGADNE